MTEQIYGAIRFTAAMVAGYLLSQIPAIFGFELDTNLTAPITQSIEFFLAVVYYILVRTASKYWAFFEYFLIIPKAPVYVQPAKQAVAKSVVTNNYLN